MFDKASFNTPTNDYLLQSRNITTCADTSFNTPTNDYLLQS